MTRAPVLATNITDDEQTTANVPSSRASLLVSGRDPSEPYSSQVDQVGWGMNTKSERVRFRRAGAALLIIVAGGLAGCVGAGPSTSAASTAGPAETVSISPSVMATQTPQASVSPTPPGGWKSIGWASLGALSWAAGSTQFQVFGWSRGYVGFSIQPNSSTNDTPVDATVVSYYSPDGVHWKQGQKLDTAGAGTQGLLWNIRSVIEGPAGLLAVGWTGACGSEYVDGLWTSSDGIAWRPVDTQKAFGQNAIAIPRISGGSAGYVAVAYKGAGVWTSADGRVWQPAALNAPAFKNSKIDDGTAFSGGYVLAGTYGTPDCGVTIGPAPTLPPATAAVWWSADAASWTRVSLPGAVGSSDGQSITVCRLSDRALMVIDDSWINSATPVVPRAAWTSTDGRTWRSVTLPAAISAADILSDGQRAIAVLPVVFGQKPANGIPPLGHLSLQMFDANYALITLQQSGDQPSIPNVNADPAFSELPYGFVALGPSGVVATDGHQLWMGTPSAQ